MPVRIKSEPVDHNADGANAANGNGSVQAENVKSEDSSRDLMNAMGDDSDDDDEEIDEEDDEVVREFDVFFSPSLMMGGPETAEALASQPLLHMMQYPLQKESMSEPPSSAKIRPRHCQIQLEYPVSDDIQCAGQFSMISRQYQSQTIPISTHLALGKMIASAHSRCEKEGLHLVPLSRIMQMRPSFTHVDEAANFSEATTDAELQHMSQQKQQPDGAGSSKPQPIGFQKKETERAAMQRKSSYAYKKQSEESEVWYPLEVYDPDADEAKQIRDTVTSCSNPSDNLFVYRPEDNTKTTPNNNNNDQNQENGDGSDKSMNAKYLQSLNYLQDKTNPLHNSREANHKGTGIDNEELSIVCSQLVKIMGQGWPMPLSIIKSQLPDVSDSMLFKALGTCAYLIHGNFILNSKYLPLTTKVGEARTFILLVLQIWYSVNRRRLSRVFAATATASTDSFGGGDSSSEVPAEALQMVLQQVAQQTKEEGWILKVESDDAFLTQHPEIVQPHTEFWKTQIRHFKSQLEIYLQD